MLVDEVVIVVVDKGEVMIGEDAAVAGDGLFKYSVTVTVEGGPPASTFPLDKEPWIAAMTIEAASDAFIEGAFAVAVAGIS